MIRYHPIDSCVAWSNSYNADLCSFDWQTNTAKFFSEDDHQTVEVIFAGADVIVRMLDEFPLSTESDPDELEGLIPHHFAYRVEGDPFLEMQSETWRSNERALHHYRFMTGAGCLDVVTSAIPHFTILES